jgi:ATP-binding cassette, subfamily B, bacterial
MSNRLTEALWPEPDLGHLLDALARKAGVEPRGVDIDPTPAQPDRVPAWVESSCAAMGLETEPSVVWGFHLQRFLRSSAPALVSLAGRGWIGLLEIRRGRALLLARDLSAVRISDAELSRLLTEKPGQRYREELTALLESCGIRGRRRERALEAMLPERLSSTPLATAWPLRTLPGTSFRRQLVADGLVRRSILLCAAHAAEYLLWVGAWYLLGLNVLQGRLDPGWLAAWALVLATMVPARLYTIWLQGVITISGGGLLRQRLLDGALQLDSQEVKHEGAGRFLGRAIETETIESLALSGGLMSALALVELILTAAVLLTGVAPWVQVPLLLVWTALAAAFAWRYYRLRDRWTTARLGMTHDLVERMTGHRTRLAQEPPEEWHAAEDQMVQRYVTLAARMDRAQAVLSGLTARSWLIVGIAALIPAFLQDRPAPEAMAISIGGLLLGWQAFRRLTAGLASIAGAMISWRQVAPLFQASARASKIRFVPVDTVSKSDTVLDAQNLSFVYPDRTARVLDGVDLEIRRGDRILLEGKSGGGKSTLVSVLAGLREPDSGLLRVGGLDRQTLGSRAWRRRIAAAPQFQENHMLSGPLAFNLLMGCNWPTSGSAIKEAEELCRELGLGPLLDRMPGGIMQMVGESGWQLSQGERSRVFMARALLQNPDLVIFDESLGALDPETLRQSLACLVRRARTLLVVAHP